MYPGAREAVPELLLEAIRATVGDLDTQKRYSREMVICESLWWGDFFDSLCACGGGGNRVSVLKATGKWPLSA